MTAHNSPIKEEMEKKEKQPSARASFAPKIPFGVNRNGMLVSLPFSLVLRLYPTSISKLSLMIIVVKTYLSV